MSLRPICARLLINEEIDTSKKYTASTNTKYVYYKSVWVNNSGANDVSIRLQYSADNDNWEDMGASATTISAGNSSWIDWDDIADLDGVTPYTRFAVYTSSGKTTVDLILMCQ